MGDERRASTLLENGAIFCIRAVFQASCRLQNVNCFIGCDLTAFLGFLGDSQGKKLFFAKEGRAESLWSYDSRIWGSSSDHSSLYLDDEYFCPSTGGITHTWEADRTLHWQEQGQTSQASLVPVAKRDTSFSFPEVVQVIPTCDTFSGPFST